MGRNRSLPLRSDWGHIKDDVMRTAVRQKFITHADIQAILLSTGDQLLVENSLIDYYWGCGKDGSGKNKLGLILMEVRTTLRQRQ
jgi:N-glycosidase YbiA